MALSYGGNTQLNIAEGSLNSMLSFAVVESHSLQQQQIVTSSSSSSSSGARGSQNSVGNVSAMRASSSSSSSSSSGARGSQNSVRNLSAMRASSSSSSSGKPVLEFTAAVHALLNCTFVTSPTARNGGQIQNGSQNQQRWNVGDVGEAVLRVLEDGLGLDVRHPSPVTKDLPLVKNPAPVVLCILLYVAGTWLWKNQIRKSGMKPRKEDPLPLRCVVVVHNLFLCCLSAFMAYGLLASAHRLGYSMWGNLYRGEETEMGMYIYFFYVSKLYEFMDTAIMLFRRNLRQITFLHVYHHATITFIWWIICYTSPGADAYFSAAFNSCIHVVMYLYYLLAATIAKDESRRRKYLFWGKYLTMLQMAQFLSFIIQSVYAMWRPALYPRGIPRLLFFYSTSLLACFGNFFVKKYNVRRVPRPTLQQTSEKKLD